MFQRILCSGIPTLYFILCSYKEKKQIWMHKIQQRILPIKILWKNAGKDASNYYYCSFCKWCFEQFHVYGLTGFGVFFFFIEILKKM